MGFAVKSCLLEEGLFVGKLDDDRRGRLWAISCEVAGENARVLGLAHESLDAYDWVRDGQMRIPAKTAGREILVPLKSLEAR